MIHAFPSTLRSGLVTLIFASALAPLVTHAENAAPTCVDLSHKKPLDGTDTSLISKQIGCEAFERQQVSDDGTAYEPFNVAFNPTWESSHVDDEFETTDMQARWFWNAGSTVLIHEFIFDYTQKKTGNKIFSVVTELYSRAETGVKIERSELKRTLTPDGTTNAETTRTVNVYPAP